MNHHSRAPGWWPHSPLALGPRCSPPPQAGATEKSAHSLRWSSAPRVENPLGLCLNDRSRRKRSQSRSTLKKMFEVNDCFLAVCWLPPRSTCLPPLCLQVTRSLKFRGFPVYPMLLRTDGCGPVKCGGLQNNNFLEWANYVSWTWQKSFESIRIIRWLQNDNQCLLWQSYVHVSR